MDDETGVKPLPRSRLVRGSYLMLRRYLSHNVAIESAALAFYLLFTIFPLAIFFSALLGLLHMDVTAVLADVANFLPRDVVNLLQVYLGYVRRSPSVRLMLFGLFFSIYFPMRATNSLMRAVRTAYHLGPPRGAFRHLLKTLLYTVFLIITLLGTLTLLTVGKLALSYAVERFGLNAVFAVWWEKLRFPAIALLMYFALYLLYAMTQDSRQPRRNIFPGAVSSLLGWMAVSFFYSYYVENMAAYSLLYGSIGTVIVLLIWLYLSATVLVMGAELNGTLLSLRRERLSDGTGPDPEQTENH
ncbi:MAG: YihY/virulence factor BrkB family protein [Oscillibacter sp.]|jgi:membrane protein|nr:YihY/virulence factor BrkB family protein [Oscillibacter sp.]